MKPKLDELQMCAESWNEDARLLGNCTAGEIVSLCCQMRELTELVGCCVEDQRNGLDVLASASWDRLYEWWCSQDQP